MRRLELLGNVIGVIVILVAVVWFAGATILALGGTGWAALFAALT
jgi:hypothetical protein